MAFGDTPQHGQDKCASCASLLEVKGHTFSEHIKKCSALEGETVPAKVTACTMYRKRTDPSLMMMMNMAWVLTLDQKKRQVGFSPPRRQPGWVAEPEDMSVGDDPSE